MEQAGGRASAGRERVLDVVPVALHQKTPLICGSRDEVDRVMRIYTWPGIQGRALTAVRPPRFVPGASMIATAVSRAEG